MGNHAQNKISVDIAADSSSLDSLSFAGLACIQDQQRKPSLKNSKQDQDFEFVSTVSDPIHNSTANIRISNGQLPLKANLLQSKNQSEMGNRISTRGSSLGTESNSKRLSQKNKGQTDDSAKANQGERNKAKEEKVGKRVFWLFSPCRTCHATEPVVRVK
ncbi:hypothetical protein CDL15_Pgr000152 [Punica granatum]|uniref:Uncharacterized protein n=1 Tax=Punica granatum TaxID=22663 RepID=A0A218Y2B6_PUNGR|nr:hypothetical protein CDL15_Pgr000152 [Punica granatum]